MIKKISMTASLAIVLAVSGLLLELALCVILGAWAGCVREAVGLFAETFISEICRVLPWAVGISLFLNLYCYKTR